MEQKDNSYKEWTVQKNDIKRMAFPFKPNCTSAWNGTVYNVQTDTAYTFAVSTTLIGQYGLSIFQGGYKMRLSICPKSCKIVGV